MRLCSDLGCGKSFFGLRFVASCPVASGVRQLARERLMESGMKVNGRFCRFKSKSWSVRGEKAVHVAMTWVLIARMPERCLCGTESWKVARSRCD
jgi:hypothetical protein